MTPKDPCREAFEKWFYEIRKPQQDRDNKWPETMTTFVMDTHYASWQAAWNAATQPHGYDDSYTTNATSGTNAQPPSVQEIELTQNEKDTLDSALWSTVRIIDPPQPPTDAQRQAALHWVNFMLDVQNTVELSDRDKKALNYIKAALQSPAVPRELSDAINKAADRKSYTWTKEYVGNRDFENEGAISLAKNLQSLLGRASSAPTAEKNKAALDDVYVLLGNMVETSSRDGRDGWRDQIVSILQALTTPSVPQEDE